MSPSLKFFGGWRKFRRNKLAKNSRFGESSTAEIQEIVGNAIPETAKSLRKSQLFSYVESDTIDLRPCLHGGRVTPVLGLP